MSIGANFLGTRIKEDALTIAQLLEERAAKDARIAELEAKLSEIEKKKRPAKPPE